MKRVARRMALPRLAGDPSISACRRLSFWVSKLSSLQSQLFEVAPLDPLAWTAVSLLLATVVLLAGWLPALRAARISPVEALRGE